MNTEIEKAQRIIYLLSSCAANKTLAPEEAKELLQWQDAHGANEIIYQQLMDKQALQTILHSWNTAETDLALNRLSLKINRNKGIVFWTRIATVAAAMVLAFSALYFFTERHIYPTNQKVAFTAGAADISPGKYKATLKLANGKTIPLSSAYNSVSVSERGVKYTDGTNINKWLSPAQTLVAATPKGGTYQIILPDHSTVWLNSSSSIVFPSSFAENQQRRVEITGEVYFEVAKDKTRPFIVKAGKQELQVLGTHFNVEAYKDEPAITTTLLEGSVELYPAGRPQSQKRYRLKPNHQARFNASSISITAADAEVAVAWKNGYFKFEEESIQSIMRKLSRWYDIEVFYEPGLPEEKFTGRISKFKNISQVLKLMSSENAVRFKIEGRRVSVIR